MKRWIWIGLATVVVVGLGVTLVAVPSGPEWTTSSPEALAEFEAGMDAEMKLYKDEAGEHFRRAFELDPDFVVAGLFAMKSFYREDEEKAEALRKEILSTDISGLTGREQYFVERERAVSEKRREDIPDIVDKYFAKYPNDPHILNQKAIHHWSTGDFETAEPLYRRLAEIAPNWVIAYNQLGYINMSRGRFAEAEEYFKSYRFIAPDQANPHDSLGELFIALGRYDEAEESFEQALKFKPDFWNTYEHIAILKAYTGDLKGLRETIERAASAGIPEDYVTEFECVGEFMSLRNKEAWQEILDLAESSPCVEKPNPSFAKTTVHLAACKIGDWDTALEIEGEAEGLLAKYEASPAWKDMEMLRAVTENMKGVRFALQGDYDEAEKWLKAADENLTYIETNPALFKLYNRTILTEIYLADGQDAEAHALLAKVRGVNPAWVTEFQDSGFSVIGLERG
jgi:tetratricopeptide (TPR) repeat protein